MEQLVPRAVRFSTLDADIAADSSAPLVESYKDLLDSRMYTEDRCDRCYPVTAHCRGHLGRISLRGLHLKYVYREPAASLCKLICSRCYCPIRLTTANATISERRKVYSLVNIYRGQQCICTGSKEGEEVPSVADKLCRVYGILEPTGGDLMLRELFRLGTRLETLTRHVYVLPYVILSQLRDGYHIIAAYTRLMESARKSSWDYSDEARCLDSVYRLVAATLGDKEGLFRLGVLSRKVPNSARAVIISDPFIGVSEVSISGFIARRLRSEVQVTHENLYEVADSIVAGDVSHVAYGKRRYQLVDSTVGIRVSSCISERDGTLCNVTLWPGDCVFSSDGTRHLRLATGTYGAVHALLSGSGNIMVRIGDGQLYHPQPFRAAHLVVRALSRAGEERYVSSLILQLGCRVTLPVEKQPVLMHRNPVLSAGSVRTHTMHIVSNNRACEMTPGERHQQRDNLKKRRRGLILGGAGNVDLMRTVGDVEHLIRGEVTYKDQTSQVMRYGIVTKVTPVYGTDTDDSYCIALNPHSVATYQGDFDGDEMNAHVLPQGEDLSYMSLVCDLDKGSFGLTHDAVYGLWRFSAGKVPREALLLQGPPSPDWPHRLNCEPHVQSFLLELLDSEQRRSVNNLRSFNRYFTSYISRADVAATLRNEYKVPDEEIASRFYAALASAFCDICDRSVLFFDRTDRGSISDLIESKARPKESTYTSIYDSAGFTTYTFPDGTYVTYIESNYSQGVTESEYLHLCYANRIQASTKAVSVAPEGDEMRMQCNYMSDMRRVGNMWTRGREVLYEAADESSLLTYAEESAIAERHEYYNVLTPGSGRLPYRSLEKLPSYMLQKRRNVLHFGQRKLLISEIDFLTDYASQEDCLVVYAGAASGAHISVLMKLFKRVRFHLYDTERFSSLLYDKTTNKPRKRLTLFKEYLTADLVRQRYGAGTVGTSRILFISDIRTKSKGSAKPTDDDVSRDNSLNLELSLTLGAHATMLKFRLPYRSGATNLLDGELRLQCWSGVESTEVRLVAVAPYSVRPYDHTEHEQQMYRHNTIRPYEFEGQSVSEMLAAAMRSVQRQVYYDMYRETDVIGKYIARERVTEAYIYGLFTDEMGASLRYHSESASVRD